MTEREQQVRAALVAEAERIAAEYLKKHPDPASVELMERRLDEYRKSTWIYSRGQ